MEIFGASVGNCSVADTRDDEDAVLLKAPVIIAKVCLHS
jgi:hypothetical protein